MRRAQRRPSPAAWLVHFRRIEDEIVTLYEPASSDGYSSKGDGKYYLESHVATAQGKQRHGNYASSNFEHPAIKGDAGKFWLLKQTTPVVLADSAEAQAEIKKAALAKLSAEERKVLGLD